MNLLQICNALKFDPRAIPRGYDIQYHPAPPSIGEFSILEGRILVLKDNEYIPQPEFVTTRIDRTIVTPVGKDALIDKSYGTITVQTKESIEEIRFFYPIREDQYFEHKLYEYLTANKGLKEISANGTITINGRQINLYGILISSYGPSEFKPGYIEANIHIMHQESV